MIVRSWNGKTTAQNAAAYTAHLRRDVIPELRRLGGFRGIRVLRRAQDQSCEFRVMTFWNSLEAVRAFAGDSLAEAVLPPAARAVLSAFDRHVDHYEVVESVDASSESEPGTEGQASAALQNELGQPVGFALTDWRERARPARSEMVGRYCRVEPIDPERHAAQLFEANREDSEGRLWTYLPYGPFETLDAYRAWVSSDCLGDDPQFHAVIDPADGRACGLTSYLRIDPAVGVIEVGHINFAPRLQRTRAATEVMYLMMRRAFDQGYRRYEWKCDALNAPSRRAAQRLGFRFEGVFRRATIYKGRNRDSAWFSIIDEDWPRVREFLEAWLDPSNFDREARQKRSLSSMTGCRLPEASSSACV